MEGWVGLGTTTVSINSLPKSFTWLIGLHDIAVVSYFNRHASECTQLAPVRRSGGELRTSWVASHDANDCTTEYDVLAIAKGTKSDDEVAMFRAKTVLFAFSSIGCCLR